MKKIAAILFLALFGFNTLGYYLFTTIAVLKANEKLEARLDKGDYQEEDLVRIDVPLSLPYTTNWTEPERVDGSLAFNGQEYKYVKRIFTNGIMTYWCIQNNASTQINEKATDYFGKVNGLPGNESSKKNSDVKKAFTDFENGSLEPTAVQCRNIKSYSAWSAANTQTGYIFTVEQPPELKS